MLRRFAIYFVAAENMYSKYIIGLHVVCVCVSAATSVDTSHDHVSHVAEEQQLNDRSARNLAQMIPFY